jgi:hypothetical protein
MAKKVLNVVHVSDRFRQKDGDKSDIVAKAVTDLGVEFVCAASFLRSELKASEYWNVRAISDVSNVGSQLAGIARFWGYDELVLPHHVVGAAGRIIQQKVCKPLSEKFGIAVRCQPVGYIPLMNPDDVTRTVLSDGLRGFTGAAPRLRLFERKAA